MLETNFPLSMKPAAILLSFRSAGLIKQNKTNKTKTLKNVWIIYLIKFYEFLLAVIRVRVWELTHFGICLKTEKQFLLHPAAISVGMQDKLTLPPCLFSKKCPSLPKNSPNIVHYFLLQSLL